MRVLSLLALLGLTESLRNGRIATRGSVNLFGAKLDYETLPAKLAVQERLALWRQVHEAEFELQHAVLHGRKDVARSLRDTVKAMKRRDAYIVLDEQLDDALRRQDVELAREVQQKMIQVGAPPIEETKPRRPWGSATKSLSQRAREAEDAKQENAFDYEGPQLLDNISISDLLRRETEERLRRADKNGVDAADLPDPKSKRLDEWLENLSDSVAPSASSTSSTSSTSSASSASAENQLNSKSKARGNSSAAARKATLREELRRGSIRVSTSSKRQTRAVKVHARALYLNKELLTKKTGLPKKFKSEINRKVATYLKGVKPPSPEVLADPSISFFLFRFEIKNENDFPISITQATWNIESAGGAVGEVVTEGASLPAQMIKPGETVEFCEACALQLPAESAKSELEGVKGDLTKTVFGRVSGAFSFQRHLPSSDSVAVMVDAKTFDAAIDPFFLVKMEELSW
eukprot:scaffold1415_cov242-Pinguiococcus_pyrenoidosus.AAC.2